MLDYAGKDRQNFVRLDLCNLFETICLITALSLKNQASFYPMRMGENQDRRMGSVVPGQVARQEDGVPCLPLEKSEEGARSLSLFDTTIP